MLHSAGLSRLQRNGFTVTRGCDEAVTTRTSQRRGPLVWIETRPAGLGSNDEREQTLNHLLTGMNGFADSSPVVAASAGAAVTVIAVAGLRRRWIVPKDS